jgi:putative membrane protein
MFKISDTQFERFIVYFTFLYTLIFSVNALARGNVEFIYYTALMVLSISIILFVHRKMHFYPIVLLSLSLLGLLHLLGGNITIGATRLYDLYFFPGAFRYDNLVHMFGSGIMVMLAHALITPILDNEFEKRRGYFVLLLVLIGMGLGAINELVEFLAVLVFDVSQQVGDYTNTLLDLVFNTIGSSFMAIFLVFSRRHLTKRLFSSDGESPNAESPVGKLS